MVEASVSCARCLRSAATSTSTPCHPICIRSSRRSLP